LNDVQEVDDSFSQHLDLDDYEDLDMVDMDQVQEDSEELLPENFLAGGSSVDLATDIKTAMTNRLGFTKDNFDFMTGMFECYSS